MDPHGYGAEVRCPSNPEGVENSFMSARHPATVSRSIATLELNPIQIDMFFDA